ncbi:MAG: hypothetical protein KKA16_04870 [Alphaproteobacteria bacterium]|nr:hypothetical protein [Alphaproteobacteria bacterium]MBU2378250.1 hypothetical protein [Alphaproteobacteria bacterium]
MAPAAHNRVSATEHNLGRLTGDDNHREAIMRHIFILAAATSLLALGACNRDAETAPAMDETAMADGTATDAAMSADRASSDASASASNAGSGSGSAMAAGETMNPDTSGMTTASGPGPVSDANRDSAKAEAEASNLHPQPSGN